MANASAGVVFNSLFEGFWLNLEIFLVTLLLAIPLGLIIMFGSRARFWPLKWITRTFVWIIRGTPLMLQLMIIFYGPGLLGLTPMKSRVTATLVAFVINYAAYFSEIYRGGIESINRGQYEAGQVLGMTKPQVFFRVILLQVIKRIVPPMGNEVITLIKDTSLANFIMVKEIIAMAKEFGNKAMIWPLFYAGVFFLVFNGIVTVALSRTEKKLDYFRV